MHPGTSNGTCILCRICGGSIKLLLQVLKGICVPHCCWRVATSLTTSSTQELLNTAGGNTIVGALIGMQNAVESDDQVFNVE